MFGSLKEKLKNWLKSSSENVEENSLKTEIKEEIIDVSEKKEDRKKSKDSKKEKKQKSSKKKSKIIEDLPQDVSGDAMEIEQEIEEGVSKEDEQIIEKISDPELQKKGFFSRLKSSFQYKITSENFDEIFDELELVLLESNVALEVVEKLRKDLSSRLIDKEIKKNDLENEIKKELRKSIEEILMEPDDILNIVKLSEKKPFVILFFGINGAGKTTSIAKTAHLLKKAGYHCVLAAGDTFRAASIEQLQIHADKLGVHLVKHEYGSDPAAVGFDAIKYAEKNRADVVLIDTAGRMHTKTNLLQEMEKIARVTKPDLKIFVAESVAGNDAVEQARAFNEIVNIDGSILSKVDVDEKGGTIMSVSYVTKKPIFYLGIGQNYGDFKLFDKEEFIKNLGL